MSCFLKCKPISSLVCGALILAVLIKDHLHAQEQWKKICHFEEVVRKSPFSSLEIQKSRNNSNVYKDAERIIEEKFSNDDFIISTIYKYFFHNNISKEIDVCPLIIQIKLLDNQYYGSILNLYFSQLLLKDDEYIMKDLNKCNCLSFIEDHKQAYERIALFCTDNKFTDQIVNYPFLLAYCTQINHSSVVNKIVEQFYELMRLNYKLSLLTL